MFLFFFFFTALPFFTCNMPKRKNPATTPYKGPRIPAARPEKLGPLHLITITMTAKLTTHVNLDVVARVLPVAKQNAELTEGEVTILGVKYDRYVRGRVVNATKTASMKNVCSINVYTGKKVLNSKLYIDGNFVAVGCISTEDADTILEHVVSQLKPPFDAGPLTYTAVGSAEDEVSPSKLFTTHCKFLLGYIQETTPEQRSRIRETSAFAKSAKALLQDVRERFFPELSVLAQDVRCRPYLGDVLEMLQTHVLCHGTGEMHTVRTMIRELMGESVLGVAENTYKFLNCLLVLFVVQRYCSVEESLFETHVKPVLDTLFANGALSKLLLSEDEVSLWKLRATYPVNITPKLKVARGSSVVGLINKQCKCGFFINREALIHVLTTHPEFKESVLNINYNKRVYAGVKVMLRVPERLFITRRQTCIKIMVFNTGHINFTAARSHEQIQYAYEFIQKVITTCYDSIIMTSEYMNTYVKFADSICSHQPVSMEPTKEAVNDGTTMTKKKKYYVLNKHAILTASLDNVRALRDMRILDKYRVQAPRATAE